MSATVATSAAVGDWMWDVHTHVTGSFRFLQRNGSSSGWSDSDICSEFFWLQRWKSTSARQTWWPINVSQSVCLFLYFDILLALVCKHTTCNFVCSAWSEKGFLLSNILKQNLASESAALVLTSLIPGFVDWSFTKTLKIVVLILLRFYKKNSNVIVSLKIATALMLHFSRWCVGLQWIFDISLK